MDGYEEETMVRRATGNLEVYGQDGYRWYVDSRYADGLAEDLDCVVAVNDHNTAFTTLVGMTRARLIAAGFVGDAT